MSKLLWKYFPNYNTQLSVGDGTVTGAINALNTDLGSIAESIVHTITNRSLVTPSEWVGIEDFLIGAGVWLVISSVTFQNQTQNAATITIRPKSRDVMRDSVYVMPNNNYSSCITDIVGGYSDILYRIEAWTDSNSIKITGGTIVAIKLKNV